eukprot:TRINITY_DN739_c1_g1_i1.p1 TRINITY_DN739_c1_g1~~TRINITY_DN739_c1_g1_i1.p1  ORF type:complete len:104 (+),score=21.67 TRINITY_DN739_c1_g1_i1:69-380(+)
MNVIRAPMRKALVSQKRTALIEIVSTSATTSLLASATYAYGTQFPRIAQEKSAVTSVASDLPLFLAAEEKRNISQLSKQLDNTHTQWDRIPSAGAFRSASTRL